MFHSFIELFSSQEKLSDKWVLFLIFLFPIAGPVIRHWNTSIFVLFCITALYYLFAKKDRKVLLKEEKIYLWAFFLFFCVFIVSTTSNGYSWEKINAEGLGTEIDFLLFIPIYLLVRENHYAQKALFAGILLSIPVIFLFSLYEYHYLWPYHKELRGAYSQLFLGPITALSLLMSIHAFKQLFDNNYRWLITLAPFFIFMGLFTISLSNARIAYITILFGSFIVILLKIKNSKQIITAFALVILIAISSYQIDTVKTRTDTAFRNFSEYFSKTADANVIKTSVGQRLEVWRSTQYIFKEHPIVGIGNGNYPTVIKKHIDLGLVSPHVINMGQAHNTFIEAIITKGSIGLILLIMIFYFPVYIAWKNKKQAPLNFIIIGTFSTAITLMSTGESMLINKNNGVSYLLIFSAVLFSSLVREINITKK